MKATCFFEMSATFYISASLILFNDLQMIEVKDIKLSLCLTNWNPWSWRCMGSECIDPHILDLGTSWRWVVSFTPRPLYPWGIRHRYSLDRRLRGPWNQSGRRMEENFLPLPGLELLTLDHLIRIQSLYRLCHPKSLKVSYCCMSFRSKIKVAGWCTARPQNFESDSLVEEGTRQGHLEGCLLSRRPRLIKGCSAR
jgi:hypothetical protein